MNRLWMAGLLLCGIGLVGIAVNLTVALTRGVEVRLPQDQQAMLDRAATGPRDVSRELAAVRHALQGTDDRAGQIQASIERLSDLLEMPLGQAENLRVEDAETHLRELQTGLRTISEELRGLRDDLAVLRPGGTRGR